MWCKLNSFPMTAKGKEEGMPGGKIKKYILTCYTTTQYNYVITAPSREAARRYYYASDCSEFHQGEEDGCELGDIEEIPIPLTTYDVDLAVDSNGNEVAPEELPDD